MGKILVGTKEVFSGQKTGTENKEDWEGLGPKRATCITEVRWTEEWPFGRWGIVAASLARVYIGQR